MAPFHTPSENETECVSLVNQNGRGPTRLVAGDNKCFGLAPIELVRALPYGDELANLGRARLLHPKPSFLHSTADLAAVLA
jgi:hypothetical protein